MRPDRKGSSSDGFALVVVLVFMLVVSAVVVPFAISTKTRLFIARNTFEQQRLHLLADGLVTVLSGRLAGLSAQLLTDGRLLQCHAGRYTFAARIQDHRGLIDLNAGDALQLAAGFEAIDFDPARAAELAEITIASRSPPAAFSNEGNGKSFPTSKRKSAPFESVSELAFLTTDAVRLDETYRVFTVHSKIGSVDPVLSPDMLRGEARAENRGEPTAGDVYSLQVTVAADSSGIVGSAGYVVAQVETGYFERISQLPTLSFLPSDHSQPLSCSNLFGEEPAQLIAEWANG